MKRPLGRNVVATCAAIALTTGLATVLATTATTVAAQDAERLRQNADRLHPVTPEQLYDRSSLQTSPHLLPTGMSTKIVANATTIVLSSREMVLKVEGSQFSISKSLTGLIASAKGSVLVQVYQNEQERLSGKLLFSVKTDAATIEQTR